MVKSFTAIIALAACLPTVLASFWGNFTNSFDGIRVGKMVHLTWEFSDPNAEVTILSLFHDSPGGSTTLQIETICQWTDASGGNYMGAGVRSLDWIPNSPGPSFAFYLNSNGVRSPEFAIADANGNPVATQPALDRYSNIMPQTATPIYYPNNPHAAAATSAPPASTTPLLSSIKVVASAPASSTVAPSIAAVSSISHSSVAIAAPTSTSVTFATSIVTVCTKCSEAASATSSVPFVNSTIPIMPAKNSTTVAPTQKPTQVVTNAATALKGSVGTVAMGVMGLTAWVGIYWL